MKHGKKSTRAQKIRLKELGLNYDNWLVTLDNEKRFVVMHRLSGKTRTLEKQPAI